MRAVLVVNPAATTTSSRTRAVIAAALETDLKLDVVVTAARGHAARLAEQARVDGIDLVVVLGGDGTVNEVVNGLLADGPAPSVPSLGVVPGGGTNVFARALGVPRDPVEATGALLAAVRAGRTRAVGLGLADDRWFTANAGMGLDAAVVGRVDAHRAAGGAHRSSDYVRATLHQFFLTRERHRPALRVEQDGVETLTGVHLAVVANTGPWTYLGERPLVLSPRAGFDTGLDLYALSRLRTLGTLGEVRRMLAGRPSDRPRHVHRRHDATSLRLVADRPLAAQVDGEYLGERDRMRLTAVPRALRVAV